MGCAKKLLLVLSLVTLGLKANATTTVALASGDWGEPALWSNGSPGCFDTIVIPPNIQMDISTTVDLESCPDSVLILLYGRIEFQNGKKLKLPCNSDIVIFPGGTIGVGSGGGSSTYVEICSTQYWNASSGDLAGPTSLCDGPCPPSMLPIELISFTAVMNDELRQVHLKWITVSEIDNDYFTVERSADGVNWEEVMEVDGAGNVSHTNVYNEVDLQPLSGQSYYRLKQTDFNGVYSYSPVVAVQDIVTSELFIYPNPAEEGSPIVVNLPDTFDGKVAIKIYGADGKLIIKKEYETEGSQQIILNLDPEITAGNYIFKVDDKHAKIIIR